jgi:uncharacterized membrane protein YqhA
MKKINIVSTVIITASVKAVAFFKIFFAMESTSYDELMQTAQIHILSLLYQENI